MTLNVLISVFCGCLNMMNVRTIIIIAKIHIRTMSLFSMKSPPLLSKRHSPIINNTLKILVKVKLKFYIEINVKYFNYTSYYSNNINQSRCCSRTFFRFRRKKTA
jgi:hypothetical protein